MILFWKIRYLDRTDKQFKNRNLSLDTKTLDVATKAAVELVIEQSGTHTDRTILQASASFSRCKCRFPELSFSFWECFQDNFF